MACQSKSHLQDDLAIVFGTSPYPSVHSLSFLQSRVYKVGAHAPSVLKYAQGRKLLDALMKEAKAKARREIRLQNTSGQDSQIM